MMTFIIFILVMYLLFKITGFMLGIFGRLLGGIFGLIGYLILGVLAVTACGLAVFALPIIIVIGIAAVTTALVKKA